ncbi:hypothetical protein [Senegalimassilia sp.]
MARAWAEFEGDHALARLQASAERDVAVVHLPEVMGGRCGDRLVCLPRMGSAAPSGRVRVLR